MDVPPGPDRPLRRTTTYAELEAMAQGMARILRPRMGPDAIVAIHLGRDTEHLYAAQLAVLQAGGAYTCIETSFPDEQVLAILSDAEPVAILTDTDGATRLTRLYPGSPVLEVGALLAQATDLGPLPPAPWLSGDSLAYLIYTSGTTGRPKGVMIQHAGIVGLVAGDLPEFGLGPGDRVGQGSSAAYDSSVEEAWLALAAGATVVVLDDATARLGPDLIPWLSSERLTVFCPPPTLLRATGCERPDLELPDLKLLYVGGEALPQDLADRWARGRRMVNGYGPTECSVTCLRAEVRPGHPITIGAAIPGMQAWVLDADLNEVPHGQPGELCMGGPGLARGYRHQPEVTAQKFPLHPAFGRLYRTGDLVHRAPDGAHHYHGRIDAQVKLRGYRIELEAVETRLVEHPGIRAAACTVQGEGSRQALVAFVVAEATADVPDAEALKAWVRRSLPSYMVPTHVGHLDSLPTTVGGKLDRRHLPLLSAEQDPLGPGDPPRNPMETAIASAFQAVLRLPGLAPIHADFFNDLGGDSLGAAMVISLLREAPETAGLTVREIYEAPTVALLALRVQPLAAHPRMAPRPDTPGEPPHPSALATLVQTLTLLGALGLGAPLVYLTTFEGLPFLLHHLGLVPLVLLAPLLSALALSLYTLGAVAFAVSAKRLLISRYEPLRAPVWGSFFIRNWLVQRAVRLVPWTLLAGTEAQAQVLRALGARIGQRVHLHRGVNLLLGGWDLLDIGDEASLGQDVSLHLVDLEAGQVVVAPIRIGAGALLEVRAGLDGDTVVGEGAQLTALSSLHRGAEIPPGQCWHGIPATAQGPALEAPPLPQEGQLSPFTFGWRLILARLALGSLLALPADLLFLGLALAQGWQRNWEQAYSGLALAETCLALVLGIPLTLALQALALRALGPVRPGVLGRWSNAYLRVWLKAGQVDAAGEWLSGTLFWPLWLRLAGMRVGPGCEISTIIDVVPELVAIGAETFFADGIYLGGPRVQRGIVTLGATRLGCNTFLGNHAVIPAGQSLPDDILLGVCTVADETLIQSGTSWFGHPPFELPRREVVACDRSLTHTPSAIRYLNRLFWEALRFTLPVFPLLVFFAWVEAISRCGTLGPWVFYGLALPLLTLASNLVFPLAILLLKWGLLGRVRPSTHPLWSCWCSRWDFLYVAWGMYARGLLAQLEGTQWLTWYLRAMGLHIGHGAVLGPGFAQVVDPDMIHIGDGATVQAMFQAHTFEDRVLKIDHVHIEAGATLGHGTVPLYGAVIGARSCVLAHSVIMKRERLLPDMVYEGAPTRPQGQAEV